MTNNSKKFHINIILFLFCSVLSSSLCAALLGPGNDPQAGGALQQECGGENQKQCLSNSETGEEEEEQEQEDAEVQSIRDRFNRNGYTVLKDFLTSDENDKSSTTSLLPLLRDDWHGFSTTYWDRIFQELHKRGHISQPNHAMTQEYIRGKLRQPGFKEIVHRNPGRYEVSLAFTPSSSSSADPSPSPDNDKESPAVSALYHDMPSLQPIIDKLEPIILSILRQHPDYKEVDGKKYNLIKSMLISAPDSQLQQFHWDTVHLNDKLDDDDEHLPAHMINVFIPLIDIDTNSLGPTELVPESHIETRLLKNPETRNQAKPLKPSVTPLMNVGDVLMFDFRILHRGLPNTDSRNINRPLLVLAFSIPSFHDTANWPGPSIFD